MQSERSHKYMHTQNPAIFKQMHGIIKQNATKTNCKTGSRLEK